MKNILKKALTMGKACGIINKQSRDSKEKKTTKYGGIAQLGEQVTGKATRNLILASQK